MTDNIWNFNIRNHSINLETHQNLSLFAQIIKFVTTIPTNTKKQEKIHDTALLSAITLAPNHRPSNFSLLRYIKKETS